MTTSKCYLSPPRRNEIETYRADLKEITKDSDDFRRVLFTGAHSQLVIMSLAPDEEIGDEVQFGPVLGDAAVIVAQAATRGLNACCAQSRKLVGLDDSAVRVAALSMP
jgi:hypothetical protein